jgi:hypothetical protein
MLKILRIISDYKIGYDFYFFYGCKIVLFFAFVDQLCFERVFNFLYRKSVNRPGYIVAYVNEYFPSMIALLLSNTKKLES